MTLIAAPAASRATLQRRDEILAGLAEVVQAGRLIGDEQGRRVYAVDAFAGHAALPLAVVLPGSVREVSQVLRFCYEAGVKVVPRGAGTSLVGGAGGPEDGIILCLSLMNNVLEIDAANRLVRVEAGITTAAVSAAVAGVGLRYAPDPSSRQVSTIGGNIATNAGGPRALLFGATSRQVLGLKVVLLDGEVIELGGGELEASGFDLIGLLLGAEGMLGVVVEAALRVIPEPEGRRVVLLGFQSISEAVTCAGTLVAGAVPTAIEVFDRQVVAACEDFASAALPRDVEALLVAEVEGHADEIADMADALVLAAEGAAPTGREIIADADRIAHVWRAFDSALTALCRLGAARCVDVAVPPARLAEAMLHIGGVAARHGLRVANMCRAAEGIVRSVILYDGVDPKAGARVDDAIGDVARAMPEFAGVLAGEHGIGVAKREVFGYRLAAPDLAFQMRLKSAFDAEWLLSSGKVFPLAAQVEHVSTV